MRAPAPVGAVFFFAVVLLAAVFLAAFFFTIFFFAAMVDPPPSLCSSFRRARARSFTRRVSERSPSASAYR
jgi:hypothetical protein